MKTFEKFLKVITNNLLYAIVLIIAIALFAIFSNGILAGLITAASALIAYVCIDKLYKEFKGNKKK